MNHSQQIPHHRHPIETHCHRLLATNELQKIVATVSGGADSMALLSALASTNAEVIAAHCNFHLRGEESNRDQQHVEEYCQKLGVELIISHFNVEEYMATHKGTSVEMACRDLRHEWFRNLARIHNADRIATGHNADDNIETLFLNLMRGSGTSGLKGMVPDNGTIIRPLLTFHRPEIVDYLNSVGIGFITDSSNLQSDYRRNFLRNEVIPLMRSRWPGFDKALDRTISHIREENNIVEAYLMEALPPPGSPLPTSAVMAFPDPELLVRRFIEPLAPFTTTAGEVLKAIKADKPDRKFWKLKKGCLIMQNHQLHLAGDNIDGEMQ